MASTGSFENYDREELVKTSSNRSFGLVFSAVFFILAYFAWKKGSAYLPLWVCSGFLFLFFAVFLSNFLAPLNIAWSKFGLLLHKIVTPVVMSLMFFVVFAPIGCLLRVLNKLSLKKGFDSEVQSYWITRQDPGPKSETMKLSF